MSTTVLKWHAATCGCQFRLPLGFKTDEGSIKCAKHDRMVGLWGESFDPFPARMLAVPR